MRRFGLLVLLAAAVLLTGCLSPRIDIAFESNPILVEQGQDKLELDVIFKMYGFSTKFRLDKLLVDLRDEDGNSIHDHEIELNESIPVVQFYEDSKSFSVPFPNELKTIIDDPQQYEELKLKNKRYTLEIILVGTKNSKATAEVIFK